MKARHQNSLVPNFELIWSSGSTGRGKNVYYILPYRTVHEQKFGYQKISFLVFERFLQKYIDLEHQISVRLSAKYALSFDIKISSRFI